MLLLSVLLARLCVHTHSSRSVYVKWLVSVYMYVWYGMVCWDVVFAIHSILVSSCVRPCVRFHKNGRVYESALSFDIMCGCHLCHMCIWVYPIEHKYVRKPFICCMFFLFSLLLLWQTTKYCTSIPFAFFRSRSASLNNLISFEIFFTLFYCIRTVAFWKY